MQVNITTFAARKELYVGQTIESLLESDWGELGAPVNLILGSEDDSHVRRYAGHSQVHLVPWDEKTNPSLRLNCTLNKIRALKYGEDETTVICEDDVRFPFDWFASLQAAAAELEGEEYVLSLFTAPDLLEKAEPVAGKSLVRQYPIETLQGAQAIFYPQKSVREQVALFLRRNFTQGCGDDLIGRWARRYSNLYATRDPLVDNIGQVSCFHT